MIGPGIIPPTEDDPPPPKQTDAVHIHDTIDVIGNEDGGTSVSRRGDGAAPTPTPTPPPMPTPPVIVIKGLSILPPRQRTTSRRRRCDEEEDHKDQWSGGLALPPLRPEEPVASLRGALGEVLGFAHLTRYRLVV